MSNAPQLPELTLAQMLRANAKANPNGIALRQKDFGIWQPTSWAEYYRRARHIGLGLRELGLSAHGHVAILSENRIEWVLAQFAAGLVGGVAVGVYPTSPASEVAYVLAHSDAEIVVCEDQEQVDKVLAEKANLPALRRIVVIDPRGTRGYAEALLIGFNAVENLGAIAEQRDPDVIDAVLDSQSCDDLALLVYTSGSTGKPKGAMLSYRNMRAAASGLIERLGFGAETTTLSYLPLCHVAEQMLTTMAPLYAGSCVSFGESIKTVQEDLREIAPSLFLAVPRIWEKLHAAIRIKLIEAGPWRQALVERAMALCAPFAETPPERRTLLQRITFLACYLAVFRALQNFIGLRCARIALTGAAPIPPGILRYFRTLGVPLVEVYGLTETSGMVSGQRLDALAPGVGTAVYNAEAKVEESTGELLIRGDMVFEGYYKNEAAAAIRDGWLHTGDVAVIEQGQIRIVDRLKDIMITAGGKNLSPSEIENTVKGSPYIKECIVIGEGRNFVAALIQIDAETVGKWAEGKGIAFTTFRNLAENPEIRTLVSEEIEAANAHLAQVAQIKRFALLVKELDHDDDEVTATLKVRRSNIYKAYAGEIEALYGR